MKRIRLLMSLIVIFGFILTSTCINVFAEDGNNIWWRAFVGPKDFASSIASKVINTEDKEYAIAGYVNDGYGNLGYATVTKTDGTGKILWSKSFRSTGDYTDKAVFTDMIELSDGSLIASGYYSAFTPGINPYLCVFVVKLTGDGKVLWQKTYTKDGDKYDSYGTNIIENDDGSVTIEGIQVHYVDGYGRATSGFALIIDSSTGSINKIYPIGNGLSQPCFTVTPDGAFVVAKLYSEIGKPYMLSLDKYNEKGITSLSKVYSATIGGNQYSSNNPRVLALEDGYLLAGDIFDGTISRYEIFRLNKDGDIIWAKNYANLNINGVPTSYQNYSIEQTRDGGFVLSNHSSYSTIDNVIFKIAADGNLDWACNYGINGPSFLNVIQSNSEEFIAVTGNAIVSIGETGDLNLAGLNYKSQKLTGVVVTNEEVQPFTSANLGPLGNDYVPTFVEKSVNSLINGAGYTNGNSYPVKTAIVTKSSNFPFSALPNMTDFGSVKKGAKSVEKFIVLKNTGTKNIKIGNAILGGANVKDFTINLKKTKMNLKPGESTTLTVVFAPKSTGSKTASISIISGASSKDKVVISVKGISK